MINKHYDMKQDHTFYLLFPGIFHYIQCENKKKCF